ncbi:Lytic transglycosylase catalytic [Thermovibrio ammonificans HB-1]|uniref:Lytic transglycosylase catalytic n=1 Tax=Thermovibrio ammonificans (strain DSM 15698 / JCM 12110 / HB-1) TaxID=648996 RepID=E8T2Y6_THEA1|nr:lytic transglycosylase domain-containing protein [Thermovibrio ammonificans]ADU97195.1 Lytic transglycosylase catalytic [Thermovibrio ammonificans HB-1]
MRLLLLLAIFLIPLNALALPKDRAVLFLNYLKSGDFCSLKFLNSFKGTSLERLSRLLYYDSCLGRGGRFPLPSERPKGAVELFLRAEALLKNGRRKEALPLFKRVLKLTDSFDEDIALAVGASAYKSLLTPNVLRVKIWRLAARGNTDEALFYLSFLRGDRFYTYLLAYTFLKSGKRKEAVSLFKSAEEIPRRYLFLTYLSRSLPEKFSYFKRYLKEGKSRAAKRRLSVYLLDYSFRKDLGFFKKVLKTVKPFFPRLYGYYLGRYYLFTGECKRVPRRPELPFSAWRSVCLGVPFKGRGVNFYSLLLKPPKSFPFKKEEVFAPSFKDSGLKLLVERGACYAVSFIEDKTPQNALAQYRCGYYRRGIKIAALFKKRLHRYPYLLKVLYPAPEIFGGDVYALAIARQESLFNRRAYSRSGAIGYMQIMPTTGRYLARKLKVRSFKVHHLFNPNVNVKFGTYYIHSLMKRFKLFPLAAAAYNGGPGRVAKALRLYGPVNSPADLIILTDGYLPFEETRDYVKRTFVNLYYYSNLYGTGKEWRIFSSR